MHQKTVVACVLTPEGKAVRTFGTMAEALLALADWLLEQRVSHVAMESPGVFWQPIYNLLEGTGLEVLVVDAQHIKAVPGRKTDVKEAEWIAELLLRHGLVRGSAIPDRWRRELIFGLCEQKGSWTTPDAEFPHYGFEVTAENVLPLEVRLEAAGVKTHPLWTRRGVEALMDFRDPSGNLFEMYCTQGFEGANKLPRPPGWGGDFRPPIADLSYDWRG